PMLFSISCSPLRVRWAAVSRGGGLGERMAFAFADRLQHHAKVVLIGSDCPAIDADYVRAALLALDEVPAVLGPAADGGYVLIGLTAAAPALFADVPWGTGAVLSVTRQRLVALRWSWRELDILPDIDRPGDLRHLAGFPKLHLFCKKELS
ncbi:TIGR04282 family arsenosugar biosynthesis glycosyltransferase, partial [Porticoccus sp.]